MRAFGRGGERDWKRIATAVVAVGRERQITVEAAGIAYYAFDSSVPPVSLVVIGVRGNGDHPVLEPVTGVDAGRVEATLGELTRQGRDRCRAAVIASVILLSGTKTTFRGINVAFSHLYGIRKHRSGLRQ